MSSNSTLRVYFLRHLYLLLPVLAGVLSAQAPSATVQNYTTKSGIEYMQGAQGPLKADAYIPNGKGPFPGLLFIHGGGWSGGSRYQMVKLIKELANQGYVSFTIEYDVDPVPYPASFTESLAALRYFHDHAEEFHLDPKHIAVVGSSAGGELAALVALNPAGITDASSTQTAGSPIEVQAAVILNGVLDLTGLGDKSKMVTQYLDGKCTEKAELCKSASPMFHIHPGAPPFYVGHGTSDETVPYAQAEAFVDGLRKDKVAVRFFTAKGGPHTYWIKDQFFAPNLADMEKFLAATLRR